MRLVSLLLVSLAQIATASTLIGNPTTNIAVTNGSDVYVERVEAFHCGAGSDVIVVDETLDHGASTSITLGVGTYCGLEVQVRWTPGESLTWVDVTGFDTWIVTASGTPPTVELDALHRIATVP